MAYSARYGSMPPTAALGRMLTIDELIQFNNALSDIIREESSTTRSTTDQ